MLCIISCRPRAPEIHSIYPKIGRMGETLTITGENFGKTRDESYITIGGAPPTGSSYISWQNNLVSFTVPEFGEAGLVYVYVRGKRSNGVLFSNAASLPRPPAGDNQGLEPRIVSITPPAAPIGSLITIAGNNFGNSHGQSGVFFPWIAESLSPVPEGAMSEEFSAVSENEFGYESWNEREIRLRVPDGAVSGNIEVRTPRGNSVPFFFDVTGRPGTKAFRDKRSYAINYSVNVKTGEAESPNTLYLWVPRPAVTPAQRNVELLSRSMEPFIENYRGTSLYKLNNLAANSDVQINLSYKIDVHAIETSIRSQSIKAEEDSAFRLTYTQSAPLLPADDPGIKNQVNALLGRERNPDIRARRIYDWLVNSGMIQGEVLEGGALEALETKRADPYMAVLLYCTMLRAAGVPSLPVAGVLVSRNRQVIRHYWAEFWIDGLGWIPVDPVLGAGAVPPPFNIRGDRASFYFGNLDNQRIAFSRGISTLSPMDPRGRPVSHSRSYALQNLWEEASGGIESYSSLWGDIIISGVYVQ
ncbi:MAG: IPT/TIG domain-containing protein [Treponema sp.]|nr:IPT/TIG domain-containing protein [Treponema sp.]